MSPIFAITQKHVEAGGADAGAYLESIGMTDLSKLNKGQWDRFCEVLVNGAVFAAVGTYVSENDAKAPF